MDCKFGYVYVHINKINGKAYVGQTIQTPHERWGKNGKKYIRNNLKFGNAIQKYGWDNFEHIILYKGCPAMLDLLEEMYIKKYDSINNGYNLTSGGNKNKIISDETKKKLREAQKNNKNIHRFTLGNKSTSKKVRCIETGEVFENTIVASKFMNKNKHSVAKCCRGEQNTCGGYHWEYIL